MKKKADRFSWTKIKNTDPTLVTVSLGHGLTHWYPGTFFIVLPFLSKDLEITYSQIGFLMAWKYFTGFFVNLPGGMLVDMVGKTGLVLGISLALSGLPYFFVGFSSNYILILLLITFVNVGSGMWHPAALAFLSKRFPDYKGFAIAVHAMGANLGDTLSPLCIGLALTFLSWRHVMILNVVPGIIMGFILWKVLAKAGTVKAQEIKKGLSFKEYWAAVKTLIHNKNILILCVLSGLRGMTQTGLFIFLPLYLANELKYSAALVGTYIMVVQATGIFSSPLAGVISDRKGRRVVLTAGLTTTSLLLLILAALRLELMFIWVLAFLGFFLFSLRPVIFAWTMDLAPKNLAGTTVSALFSLQFLFSAIAPAVCGLIADRFGILYTFYFLAFTIFMANFLVYMVPSKAPERETAATSQP